jgi:hypothetical protein
MSNTITPTVFCRTVNAKEHRFSLLFTSFGGLNFSDETILHKTKHIPNVGRV